MRSGKEEEGPHPAGRAVMVSSGPQHPPIGRSQLEHCLGVCSGGPLGGVPAERGPERLEDTGGETEHEGTGLRAGGRPGSAHSSGTMVRAPRSRHRLGLPEPWVSLSFMGEGSPECQEIQDPRSHPEHHPSPPTSHQHPLRRCRSRAAAACKPTRVAAVPGEGLSSPLFPGQSVAGAGCRPRRSVWALQHVWLYQGRQRGTRPRAPGTCRPCAPSSPTARPACQPVSLPTGSCSAPSRFKENSSGSQGDGQTHRPSLAHSHPDRCPGPGRMPPQDCAVPPTAGEVVDPRALQDRPGTPPVGSRGPPVPLPTATSL